MPVLMSRFVPLRGFPRGSGILPIAAAAAAIGCHRSPTYYEDVQPIFERSCVQCHRRNGVAPTPELGSFEHAAAFAEKIRLAIQMHDMPPWGADNSGYCGTWRDALWLRDEELRMLTKWTEDPRPGDASRKRPSRPPAPPAFRPSGVVLDTGGDFRPGLGPSAYRCFVVGPAVPRDRIATAFRIVSTEPRSVQQLTLYAVDSPAGDDMATALDGEDPDLGYTCYGSSRIDGARLLTSWTWDSPVSRLPAGFGVRVPGARKLVVQIHYNPIATGLDVPTHTRVELELDDGAQPASYLAVAPEAIDLPPRMTHAEARAVVTVPRAMRVLGVAPRMHTLGKTMQLERSDAGSWRCMSSFDHWNFYRQRLFELESPVVLDAGARLRVTCAYDTESRGEPTRLGQRIEDEECLAELLVTD
jgi:hypothetical protein